MNSNNFYAYGCLSGNDAYNKLNEIYGLNEKRTLLAVDNTAYDYALKKLEKACNINISSECVRLDGKAVTDNIGKLFDSGHFADADVIIACGGEAALDAARCAGDLFGKTVILLPSIPVTASHTGKSVLINSGSGIQKVYRLKSASVCTVLDTDVLCRAPVEYLQDTLCEVFYAFWRAEESQTSFAESHFAAQAVRECSQRLRLFAFKACSDNRNGRSTESLEKALLIACTDSDDNFGKLLCDENIFYFCRDGLERKIYNTLVSRRTLDQMTSLRLKPVIRLAMLMYCGNVNEFYSFKEFCLGIGAAVRFTDLGFSSDLIDAVLNELSKDGGVSGNLRLLKKSFDMLER